MSSSSDNESSASATSDQGTPSATSLFPAAEHMFRTAIRLKRAIDAVPKKLSSIGTIVNTIGLRKQHQEDEAESEEENNDDDEDDDGASGSANSESGGSENGSDDDDDGDDDDTNVTMTDPTATTTAATSSVSANARKRAAPTSAASASSASPAKPTVVSASSSSSAAAASSSAATSSSSESKTDSHKKQKTKHVAKKDAPRTEMDDSTCKKLYQFCRNASRSVVMSHTFSSYGFPPHTLKDKETHWIRIKRPGFETKPIPFAQFFTVGGEGGSAPSDPTGAKSSQSGDADDDEEEKTSVPAAAASAVAAASGGVGGGGALSLWDTATQSGFGDVASQTTKVDLAVRNARELTTDEFDVDSSVGETLARVWSKYLFPQRVKAVPYKVNLYGPGGKFSKHRDTPQLGLVGTALVGLGDTTDKAAGLALNDGEHVWRANAGEYILFYPDVPHEVLEITTGHRATIAYKIMADPATLTDAESAAFEKTWNKKETTIKSKYEQLVRTEKYGPAGSYYSYYQRTHTPNEAVLARFRSEELDALDKLEEERAAARASLILQNKPKALKHLAACPRGFEANRDATIKRLRRALLRLKTPFGLLLNHRYNIHSGSTMLGADQLLYEVLSEIPAFKISVFPVLTHFHEEEDYDSREPETECSIYPITDAHIDYALKPKSALKKKEDGKKKMTDTTKKRDADEPPTPGFDGVVDELIPFICDRGLGADGFQWKRDHQDSVEHVGNNSQPEEETSIYLHKALVITR